MEILKRISEEIHELVAGSVKAKGYNKGYKTDPRERNYIRSFNPVNPEDVPLESIKIVDIPKIQGETEDDAEIRVFIDYEIEKFKDLLQAQPQSVLVKLKFKDCKDTWSLLLKTVKQSDNKS